MKIRKIILAIFILLTYATVANAEQKEIFNKVFNEKAKASKSTYVWKTVSFSAITDGSIKLILSATLKEGKKSDYLRFVLTDKSLSPLAKGEWTAKMSKGKPVGLGTNVVVSAGALFLNFYADNTPTLNSVKVTYDDGVVSTENATTRNAISTQASLNTGAAIQPIRTFLTSGSAISASAVTTQQASTPISTPVQTPVVTPVISQTATSTVNDEDAKKVKEDVKTIKKETPSVKDASYIDKVGVKLIWDGVTSGKSYEIYKTGEKENNYQKIAQKFNNNVFIDDSVIKNETYKYKIAGILENGTRTALSDEFKIKAEEKIIPQTPLGFNAVDSTDKVMLKWDNNRDQGFDVYVLYKKEEDQREYKKIIVGQDNKYEDTKVEPEKKYFYRISSVNVNGLQSEMSEELKVTIKTSKYKPSEVVDIYPKVFYPGDKVTVYFSAKKSKEIRKWRQKLNRQDSSIPTIPTRMFIRFGFNSWDIKYNIPDGREPEMTYDDETEYFRYDLQLPSYAREIDLAFVDDLKNWDKNYAKDYVYKTQKDKKSPGKVKNIRLTPKNNMIYFEWDSPDDRDVEYYMLLKSNNDKNGFDTADAIVVNNIKDFFTRDETAKAGVKNYYRIRAVDTSGNLGEMSETVFGIASNEGLLLTDSCKWEPEVPSLGGIVKIYYSKTKGKFRPDSLVQIRVGTDNWKNSEVKDMRYDKIYDAWYYEYQIDSNVQMVNVVFTDGISWDNNAGKNWNISIKADTVPPGKVTELKAVSESKQIMLDWKALNEVDLYGYNIYRDDKKINKEPVKTNYYKDTEIVDGIRYKYRVTGVDFAKNEGSVSEEASVKTLRDIIELPEGIEYVASLRDTPFLRLLATLSSTEKWQLDIINERGKVVRTYWQKSDIVNFKWDLRDDLGKLVIPGMFKYRITIIGVDDVLVKEVPIRIEY